MQGTLQTIRNLDKVHPDSEQPFENYEYLMSGGDNAVK